MSVVFDTNVLLDVLLARPAFMKAGRQLMQKVETGALKGMLCATTVTTVDYLTTRELGRLPARQAIAQLLDIFDIAAVTQAVLRDAIHSPMTDFEDAVIAHAAQQAGAQAIITRNLKDFTRSPVPAYTPEQWLMMPG